MRGPPMVKVFGTLVRKPRLFRSAHRLVRPLLEISAPENGFSSMRVNQCHVLQRADKPCIVVAGKHGKDQRIDFMQTGRVSRAGRKATPEMNNRHRIAERDHIDQFILEIIISIDSLVNGSVKVDDFIEAAHVVPESIHECCVTVKRFPESLHIVSIPSGLECIGMLWLFHLRHINSLKGTQVVVTRIFSNRALPCRDADDCVLVCALALVDCHLVSPSLDALNSLPQGVYYLSICPSRMSDRRGGHPKLGFLKFSSDEPPCNASFRPFASCMRFNRRADYIDRRSARSRSSSGFGGRCTNDPYDREHVRANQNYPDDRPHPRTPPRRAPMRTYFCRRAQPDSRRIRSLCLRGSILNQRPSSNAPFVSGGRKFDTCGGRKSDSRQHGLAAG